jgi:hypothetical protein
LKSGCHRTDFSARESTWHFASVSWESITGFVERHISVQELERSWCLASDAKKRIGVAAGNFQVPDDIDGQNAEIEAMFYGKSV